jgi:DNA-binding ferritin-like protein (Dps family)
MKQKDLINLLNRAAASYETPGDLDGDDLSHLVEDLTVAAAHFSNDTELSNLLNRAAAGLETPADLSDSDIASLVEDLTTRATWFVVDRNDEDDKVFAAMHGNKERFSLEAARAAFSGVKRREKE